ncbi:unnamed protein product [Closterium sp. Yama58-4]|nr:unnamed protein product [Closterium sp. Yama58-4]
MPVRCALACLQIMATVPAAMILYERGLLVRMLLSHTAGLREFHPFFALQLSTRQQVIDFIMADHLWYPPIVTTRYSDLSMIVLALVIERITGCHLSTFVHREIFSRLGMTSTAFRPIPGQHEHGSTLRPITGQHVSMRDAGGVDPRVVPTEVDSLHRKKLLWGEGGTDPTTGRQLVSSRTLRLFTTPPPPSDHNPRPFALGWDVAIRRGKDGYTSAGRFMGPRTFGHTGFTGTSLWIDPDRNIFVALLSNAVHPSVDTPSSLTVRDVRPLVANAAVTTLGQLGLPRRSLTWHLGRQTGVQADVETGTQTGVESGDDAQTADGSTRHLQRKHPMQSRGLLQLLLKAGAAGEAGVRKEQG